MTTRGGVGRKTRLLAVGVLALAPWFASTAQEVEEEQPPPDQPAAEQPENPPPNPPPQGGMEEAEQPSAVEPPLDTPEESEPVAPSEPGLVPPAEPAKPRTTTGYFRELMNRQIASVGDGLRVMVLAESGKDEPGLGSAARAEYLVGRKIIPDGWADDPKQPLTKGVLAHMVCRTLGIRGGLMNFLTAQSRRYAFRETKYRDLMGGASHEEYVTGPELLAVLRRVGEEKRTEGRP